LVVPCGWYRVGGTVLVVPCGWYRVGGTVCVVLCRWYSGERLSTRQTETERERGRNRWMEKTAKRCESYITQLAKYSPNDANEKDETGVDSIWHALNKQQLSSTSVCN